MTLTQFKYVLEVEKTGSINHAAKNLFVSQSVLSTSIKNLEEELGYTIFSRTNRGILCTPLGKTFISYIRPIHEQVQNINRMIADVSEQHTTSLSIASSGWTFLSEVICKLHQRYQTAGLRIEYYEAFGTESENMVANQIADIGFGRRYTCYQQMNQLSYKSLKLQFFPIYLAEIGVTVSPANPLFYLESNYITTDMLKDSVPILHTYFDGGPYSNILKQLDIPISANRFMVTSRAAMYEILAKTNSYYLNSVFTHTDKNIRTDDVVSPQRTLVLKDCDIKSEFGWFKRENTALSSIAMDLVNMVSEYFSNRFVKSDKVYLEMR